MAVIAVQKWIAGTVAPTGATVFPLIVITSAPVGAGRVTFTHKTGVLPTGLGPAEIKSVTINATTVYYAELAVTLPSVGVTEGEDMTLTATPSDDNGPGTAMDHAFAVHTFGSDSGTSVNINRTVITTPASMSAIDGHLTVFMRAFKADNTTILEGAMVRFTPSPTASITVNQEILSTTPADLGPGFYYALTDATGSAAIRIATDSATVNKQISVLTVMTGIEHQRTAVGYFVNNVDDRPEELQALWTPPTATVEDQQIPIPASGKFFSLSVSVNNETNADYKRFVVVNNDTVYPYEQTNDGYIQVRYSALKQSPDPSSNSFTYVRQNAQGNIACSEPWECGVSGVLDNLPDPADGPRVLPAPLVDPSPGVGRIINLSTLAPHDGLQLKLTTPIDPANLPGWVDPNADKTLTAVFYFYMNGYLRNGDIRTPYVYTSSVTTDGITAPTAKYDNATKKIVLSAPFVKLSTGGANGWGHGAGNETMKVGFEYTIDDGTNLWYSEYSELSSWYYIDTGGW